MFKYLPILFISVFIGEGVYAMQAPKTVQVSGKISDEATGQILQGASIYFPELKKGVVSNDKGIYQINVKPGNYIIEVSYIGFSLQTINISIQNNLEKDFMFD